ncbi:MAG: DNA-processing protein DprA [Candidatus Bipolaricaulia bacterium]
MSPRRANRLFARFESFRAIWEASSSKLGQMFNSQVIGEALASGRDEARIDEELSAAEDLGVSILTLVDADYPPLLREIEDPPLVLYVRGEPAIDPAKAIAVIGTRRSTRYSSLVAARLASQLAMKGITVVGGLAAGTDAAAHQGALDVGGRTVAVMGCGVDRVYPKRNQAIYDGIVKTGTVISEYPLGTRPAKWTFPQRNRIISGLSRGVVVVQAPERSGALITARLALEQGRDVFAVPGNITNRTSTGTNRLLKDGATLVVTVDDILNEYPDLLRLKGLGEQQAEEEGPKLGEREQGVFDLISLEPVHVDDIIGRADLSPTEASHILLLLQLEGLIEEVEGGRYIRKP